MGDDRRIGPSDRRVEDRRSPSTQFQSSANSNIYSNNSQKNNVGLVTFVVAFIILLVFSIVVVCFTYFSLNKSYTKLDDRITYLENSLFEDTEYYDDIDDTDSETNDDNASEVSNTNSTETNRN